MARGDKPATKKRELYFNSDTQAAIVEHQFTSSSMSRDHIFNTRIYPAFDKLAENLINIHRFTGQYDSHDDLKADCITFLYEAIPKFDAKRGTNAFSYFNVVAKRWLIIKSKKRVQNQRRFASIDDPGSLTMEDADAVEHHSIVPAQDVSIMLAQRTDEITSALSEVKELLHTNNEHACIDAIMILFEMAGDIDLLGKSSILLYIREISGLSPKQLTVAMHGIKRAYHEVMGDEPFAWDEW